MPLDLPIFAVKQELLHAMDDHGCVVLTAPTGSGKSTQVPQFLLEHLPVGRILVLQPRRLAARMLAERVASERGERLGATVGFQTRYEQALSKDTRILFLTEGILSRMLVADPTLPGIVAIVFDEFHERSLHTDLGLAMAHETRRKHNPDLRLVVMSATIDAKPVCDYLDNCPHVHAEGQLFPVDITYSTQQEKLLGPATAAAKALGRILASGQSGDVLVFMPGGYEIRKTIEACAAIRTSEKLLLLPLYGNLPPEEQRKVMEPASIRKVIVATNIAETSLTIPGVRHVIDSGLARVSHYDPVRGVDSLLMEGIARDSADQRAGRAGREAPGTCQRLWSWLEYSQRPARTVPEILRMDLAEAVLAVNAFGFQDASRFPWYEAPPARPLAGAEALLVSLGFLKPNHGGLTALGRELAAVPAHPRLSLLMHLGAKTGCFHLTAWAAALLSERPLITASSTTRENNTQRRQNARQNAKQQQLPASDFLEAFELVRLARDAHFAPGACQALGINATAARDILRAAEDLCATGARLGWDKLHSPTPELHFLQCLLQTFPDRLVRRADHATLDCILQDGRHASLARESVVRDEPLFLAAELRDTSGKLTLSLASGFREDWLLDCFPDDWLDQDVVFWDERRQQVLRKQTLSCRGLLLEEKVRSDPDPEQAAAILAQMLIDGKAPVPNWDDKVERYISRVRWLATVFPEQKLPAFDEQDRAKILRNLCLGESSLKRLKDKDTFAFVKGFLPYEQQRFVDAMAPEAIPLPNGRRMKIEYVPGQQPKGRAKIQDLYDLPRIPEIAAGRARVLLDILAPNFRTVQITEDLENFWATLYPKIRTELARRYPKHQWR
ncbi:MAG: ATP-dependent helicase HrpB [Victivallales bacterium]|nr:ATP-dependent helicase HrpB [Victivallales bacterium]